LVTGTTDFDKLRAMFPNQPEFFRNARAHPEPRFARHRGPHLAARKGRRRHHPSDPPRPAGPSFSSSQLAQAMPGETIPEIHIASAFGRRKGGEVTGTSSRSLDWRHFSQPTTSENPHAKAVALPPSCLGGARQGGSWENRPGSRHPDRQPITRTFPRLQ